jgi:conjugal transfer pilus assembly protein TraV
MSINLPLKIPALLAIVLITGCASQTEYGCKGFPEGVQCKSTRDIYMDTSHGLEIQSDLEVSGKRGEAGKGANITRNDPTPEEIARMKAKQVPTDRILREYVHTKLPYEPVPIRTPSQVMRIWVAPYEDKAGDLLVPGLVFTDIEERKWVIGEPVEDSSPVLRPLQGSRYKQKARGSE